MESHLINTLYAKHFLHDPKFVELVPDVVSTWFLDLIFKQSVGVESKEGASLVSSQTNSHKKGF